MSMFVPRSVTKHLKKEEKNLVIEQDKLTQVDIDTTATNSAKDTKQFPGPPIERCDIQTSSLGTGIESDSLGAPSVPVDPPAAAACSAVVSKEGLDSDGEEDDEPVLSYSKYQRMPEPGEPVCVVCGRYGAYIVDQTDQDICSLECKGRHLHRLGLPLIVSRVAGKKETKKVKDTLDLARGEPIKTEVSISSTEEWTTYLEHPHIVAMTGSEVQATRSKYSISVRGRDAPKPVTEFNHLGLPCTVTKNLTEAGYTSPTPVQMQSVPAALLGRDLLVCATTGSGKTLSFLLPVLLNILRSSTPQQRAVNPRALVLAPTRELAMQIEQQAKDIMKGIPVMRTALLVGGVPLPQQLHRLRAGVQVVIATPARLNDIILHHTLEIELMDIEILVVDEVDCLLQMGFEKQFQEIEEVLPRRRQNLMFSATIPLKIKKLAFKMMENPLSICIGEPSVPCDSIKHIVIWVEENSKRKKLMALLNDQKHFQPPAVVFVNSKMGALLLAEAINKIHSHLSAIGLHGDMAQDRRSEIVRGCSEGKYSIVVATNILGRGLDLVSVRQVILFDMPNSITEFIHQVGRAGRLDSPGTAYTFINNSNKAVFMDLVGLLQRQGVQLPVQLTSSPFLQAQQERRKRDRADGERERRTKKRKSEHPQVKSYHDRSSMLEMIKASTR